jgi:DNA-binding transcriptional LysR family regulator
VKEPKPPADLGAEGRRLWRDILRDAAGQGVELTAQELVYLRQAGKLADAIARMEADVAEAPTVVAGYLNRGNVIQPLLPELRMHRQLLGQMLARVKTDMPEAPGIPMATGTGDRFRAAAMTRWHGGGV